MRIASYLLIALVVFIVFSCENRELTYLNIVKDGTFAWEEKEPCTIIYSDSKNSDSIIGKIKCRGGVSSKYYKHSFSLELERKYSFKNLPYDDDSCNTLSPLPSVVLFDDILLASNNKTLGSKSVSLSNCIPSVDKTLVTEISADSMNV